jgi:hydrogenase-4 component E
MTPLPFAEWLPRSSTVNLLAGAFLLAALLAAGQRRTLACIAAYRWNSVALALIALAVAVDTGTVAVGIVALLVLAAKAGVIPALLARRASSSATAGRGDPEPLVPVPVGLLVCGVLVVVGFSQTRELFGSDSRVIASCLPVSVSTLLVGLFIMVSRRQALLQVVGLVLVENAIFLAAVSLTYGMPLVIEMGGLLDLLVGVAMLGLFVGRIEETHGDTDTTRLRSLRG